MNQIMPTLPKKDNPCIDCIDRHTSCHSSCEKYKIFKEKISIMRKKERESYMARSFRTAEIYGNGYSVNKNRKKTTLKSIYKVKK